MDQIDFGPVVNKKELEVLISKIYIELWRNYIVLEAIHKDCQNNKLSNISPFWGNEKTRE